MSLVSFADPRGTRDAHAVQFPSFSSVEGDWSNNRLAPPPLELALLWEILDLPLKRVRWVKEDNRHCYCRKLNASIVKSHGRYSLSLVIVPMQPRHSAAITI